MKIRTLYDWPEQINRDVCSEIDRSKAVAIKKKLVSGMCTLHILNAPGTCAVFSMNVRFAFYSISRNNR